MRRSTFALAFVTIAAVLLGTALGTTPGAIATHVQEPTTPITGLSLRVLHYSSGSLAPCDGSEFLFTQLRLEMRVTSETKPSEHFDAFVSVARFNGRVWLPQWVTYWEHSNIPPHTFPASPKAWLSNQYTTTWLQEPGLHRINAKVTTLESGQTFFVSCEFTIPNGAAG